MGLVVWGEFVGVVLLICKLLGLLGVAIGCVFA